MSKLSTKQYLQVVRQLTLPKARLNCDHRANPRTNLGFVGLPEIIIIK